MLRTGLFHLALLGAFIGAIQLQGRPAQAVDVQIFDEQTLTGLLPAALLDSSGFEHRDGYDLAAEGLHPELPIIPMFPMFKSEGAAKKFLGVQIPAQYLGTQCSTTPGRTMIMTARPSPNTRLGYAMEQISKIEMEDGSKLTPFYHNCTLYGIPKGTSVDASSEVTKGMNLKGFQTGEILNLGQSETYGISLNLRFSETSLNAEKGFNFAKSFNSIFQNVDLMVSGETAESLISKTMRFSPYIQAALVKNHESALNVAAPAEGSSVGHLPAVKNKNFDLGETYGARYPSLPTSVPADLWSKELQSALSDRRSAQTLEFDQKMKKEMSYFTRELPLFDSGEANRLVQRICNYLAQAYEVPTEIWPRCRIQATWQPNAFAMPGGEIFISAGLLGVLSDLDSVALVLGHEIGHLIGRHHERSLSKQNAVMYFSNALSLAALTTSLPFTLKGGAGVFGNVNWLTYFPQSMAASMSSGYLSGKAQQIAMFGPVAALMSFQRSYEWEADRFGHQAAIAIGANQDKIHSGWEEFRGYVETYLGVPSSMMEKIMASHPGERDRESAIQKRYPEIWQNLQGVNAQTRLPESYYETYSRIHQELKPHVIAFGEELLSKKQNKGRRGAIIQEYAAQSLFSPAGQCVQFALGLGGH